MSEIRGITRRSFLVQATAAGSSLAMAQGSGTSPADTAVTPAERPHSGDARGTSAPANATASNCPAANGSLDGFEPPFDHEDGSTGIMHRVYCTGGGPAVLLLHELPGMTEACIGWARELAERGFRVYLPLLFGAPRDNHSARHFLKLCISREFRLFARGGGSPIAEWLRGLCRHIRERQGVDGLGVIGMCLTGNFAIGLIADEAVLAAVSSQPSLPMLWAKSSLALSPQQLAAAQKRSAGGVPLMCLRFSNDSISPSQKFEAIRKAFAGNFKPYVISSQPGNDAGIDADAHSVLTHPCADRDGHPARQARDEVVAFLDEHLGGRGSARSANRTSEPGCGPALAGVFIRGVS